MLAFTPPFPLHNATPPPISPTPRHRTIKPRFTLPKMSDQQPWIENFTTLNTSQEQLHCVLSSAQLPAPKSPVLVLCHGFTGSKNAALMQALNCGLLGHKLSICRFDFSGNGDSEGRFGYAGYMKEVEDLRSVILEVERRGFVVDCIVGHSKGGGVVLLYGAKYGIGRVVNLAGRFDMGRGIEERFGKGMEVIERGERLKVRGKRCTGDGEMVEFEYEVGKKEIEERKNVDMGRAVEECSRKGVKVITVHGNEDRIIPVEDGREIGRRVGEFREISGGHSFEGCEDQIVEIIAQFCSD